MDLRGSSRVFRPRRTAAAAKGGVPRALLCSFFAASAFLSLAEPLLSQDASQSGTADSGVFEIFASNNPIGTESFRIQRSDSGWQVSSELQLDTGGGKKASESATLVLDAALRPVSYLRKQQAPLTGELSVQFGTSETTLIATAGGSEPQEQVFYLPANDLVVLDTNFFHQYTLLLRMYNRETAGAQPFHVFIPQEALPGTISLQYGGREAVGTGRQAADLDHYQAVTDELQIEIWATPQGAIQRLSIPQANLDVVRR
jgi:hypothetical protein